MHHLLSVKVSRMWRLIACFSNKGREHSGSSLSTRLSSNAMFSLLLRKQGIEFPGHCSLAAAATLFLLHKGTPQLYT